MDIRSFLAFELPRDVRIILERVALEAREYDLPVKWVKVQNIHLTMVFLGNVSPDVLEFIQEQAQSACLEFGPFSAAIGGMGTFPNRRNPRVLWLGLKGELERLSLFRDALQQNLGPFGIKVEKRPFRPHLTLGRFRKGKGKGLDLEELLSRYEEVKSPSSMLSELVLFRSDLKPTGAVYTRLAAWPLSGAK